MKDIVLLKPENYYSQRNNKINPLVACMPTTRVMFYIANNLKYTNKSKLADDDYFMDLLNTKKAKDFCYKKYTWAYNKKEPDKSLPPNQIHGMYSSYLDEIVLGKRMTDFADNLTFDDYMDRISSGMAIMTSGSFDEIKGHAFLIMGIKNDNLLIADPYGNFHTGYKNQSGYAVEMTRDEFNTHVKPDDSFDKWGHILLG